MSWTKDDQDILPDEREVLGSNGTLIIRDSTLEDSGNYTCTASSRIGQTSSTSAVAVSGSVLQVTGVIVVLVLSNFGLTKNA